MAELIIENGELKKYNGRGDVVISDGVTVIGEAAFWNSDISSVKLPKGLKKIKDSAFAGCRGLKEMELPDSVLSIGKSAFARSGIETIRLSSKLKQIPRDAFHSSALHEIVLHNGVKSIADNAFSYCRKLKKVVLPNSLEKIGYHAFENDISLQEINLPPNTQLEGGVFDFCNGLADSNGFIVINGAFFKSPALYKTYKVTLPDGVKTIKTGSIDIRRDVDGVMWVTNRDELFKAREDKVGAIIELPSSVERVESGAFLGEVEEIICYSTAVFEGFSTGRCTKLKRITVLEGD